ncbi:hypothetical protein EJ07DRAFT_175306 [Lizonia empirigonia]|nr:hypothetical protein EJ07DRAFT_175306 [Lizonia empirigonia]
MCCEVFWAMVPSISVLYMFWLFKGHTFVQNPKDFTDALENHDRVLQRIIEKKFSEAIQASKQVLAEEEAKLIRVAESYENELSVVKESNATNERKVAFLEDQLQNVEGQVQTLKPALTDYIHSETRKTIEDAERDSMRKLILTFTPSEHETLKELHDKFYDYEASVQKLLEVPAQLSELKAGMKQQSDRLVFTLLLQALMPRSRPSYETKSTHDKQLQDLVKIPAAVNDLKAEFKAFTEHFHPPTTTSSVLSTIEDKLQEHDNQLKQLSGNQTTIETLVQQHEELESRLDKLEESTIGEQLKDQSILELERKFSIIETSIAEVDSIPSQINALDDRTKTLEADSTYHRELCKQLKTSIGEVENLAKSLASCEERVTHLETSMKSSADNLRHVTDRIPALEKQLRDATTHITKPRIDTKDHVHVGELEELRTWVTEGEKDINMIHGKVGEVTASLEKLEADVKEHVETLHGKMDGATMALAKLELDAEFRAGFQQHEDFLNYNFGDIDMLLGHTDVPVDDNALPAEANNAQEAAPFTSNGPAETLQQPSSFNASSFQNTTFDFSFPVTDPPPPTSGNGPMAFSAPFLPPPAAAPTTDAPPALSWPNPPTPQEDMSSSGPFPPSNAEPPLVDEQMKDWNAYYEEHGVPEEGEGLEEMMAELGEERDEDEMGSDRDAEGETDDEDAEFGFGY